MNVHKLDNIANLPENIIVTIGMFDGVHLGHKKILSFLKDKAVENKMIPVVVTFNKSRIYFKRYCVFDWGNIFF